MNLPETISKVSSPPAQRMRRALCGVLLQGGLCAGAAIFAPATLCDSAAFEIPNQPVAQSGDMCPGAPKKEAARGAGPRRAVCRLTPHAIHSLRDRLRRQRLGRLKVWSLRCLRGVGHRRGRWDGRKSRTLLDVNVAVVGNQRYAQATGADLEISGLVVAVG